MSWRRNLGLCLLVLTAAGCGTAGRASLPVESAPDAASARAAGPAEDDGAAAALSAADVAVLRQIRLAPGRATEAGLAVEIESSTPVNYTSYQPDPFRFIVEIPGVELAALPPALAPERPGFEPVKVVALPSHGGGSHARFEFAAGTPVEARVVPAGSVLAVILEPVPQSARFLGDVGPAAGEEAPEAPAGPGAASPESLPPAIPRAEIAEPAGPPPAAAAFEARPPEPRDAASQVSGVIVEGSGSSGRVEIIGDGAFRHHAFVLKNPDRLVVDLIDVVNRVPEKQFDVAADPLQRVRVAQFRTQPEKVVRVVFDLTRPVAHRVVSDDDGLRVLLGEAATAAVHAAPAPSAAPVLSASKASPAQEPPRPEPGPAAGPAVTVTPLPDLAPRLVPSSPSDLGRDVVLFDRADPGQEGKEAVGTFLPPGTTFQSQTIAGERRRYRGEKISVTFRDADVREVFFFFADVMKMNVVLDPDVTGRIDIRLTQVPWDQAFQVILKNQGLDAVEEDNVIRIAKTQKLRQEAAERRALKQAQEQEVDPVTFTRKLSYGKVVDAIPILTQVKSDRGKIVADVRTNTLIIVDIPDKRAAYENLLSALDAQTPQVSIEARIVEAVRQFERSLGIDWSFSGTASPALGTQTNLQFPHRAEIDADVNLGSPKNAGTLGISLGNVLDSVTLDVTLDAFEADGKVRILSAPKVVTQNNLPAQIEQGVQIPIVTTTATEIEVQYIPASLRLQVTPQITAEETVIMNVRVENNQPSTTVSVGDQPGIVTERVETNILVRSGTTAVIGGVYKLQESDTETGLPGLRRIPFFGWLFKNKAYRKDSSELLVFLTPKIVTNV